SKYLSMRYPIPLLFVAGCIAPPADLPEPPAPVERAGTAVFAEQAEPTVWAAQAEPDEPDEPDQQDEQDDPVEPDEPDEPDQQDDPVEPDEPNACEAHEYPVPVWPTGLPEEHGFDPVALSAAADLAEDNHSNCLMVVRHGVVVGEWYWQGTTPTTRVKNWSVAKSYSSTVVGLAIDRGDLESVDQPAADHLPQWQGTDNEIIRLHDLMAMSSGLQFNLLADNVSLPLAADMTALAVQTPLANPPGSLWEYNNHAVQALEPVLRAATGMSAAEYANEHLFEPLGMDVEWKHDQTGHPALFMNARTSCRDNARFGYLFLRNGCWNGEQLLSEEWVEAATSPSTSLNRGYGYWWWLSGQEPTLDSVDFSPKPPGGLHPFAPDDAFCAAGLGNQFIEVIPSLDLVVVRMGTAPQDVPGAWSDPAAMLEEAANDGHQLLHNALLELVLDALTEP
ncbi:MAG: CubicO group peptidase (beta-lactamase class C family), partial [Myxococcota bacterium]